ncbi:MAG: hypothetical protein R6U04_11465 [Bacteroidales bacterium]
MKRREKTGVVQFFDKEIKARNVPGLIEGKIPQEAASFSKGKNGENWVLL